MPYLSRLIGTRVLGPGRVRLGRVRDVIASGDVFPTIVAIEVGPDGFLVPWNAVRRDRNVLTTELSDRPAPEAVDGMRLARALLDRQIIDARGRKVVRVNDVQLAEFGDELRVAGVDVGARSFLRRLGLERVVVRLADALGYDLPDAVIPWSYVASLEPDARLRLGVDRELLDRLRPVEVAEILDALSPAARARFLEVATDPVLAASLWEATPAVQAETLAVLGDRRAAAILGLMAPDEAADVLGGLSPDVAARFLAAMSPDERAVAIDLLGYRPNSAGGLMTPQYVAVPTSGRIDECLTRLRAAAPDAESIYYVYAVDDERRLEGVVPLRALLTSEPDTPVGDIVRPGRSVRVDADDEEVAARMEQYDLLALPVVDDGGRLVGIITVDDVIRQVARRAGDDIAALSGGEETGRRIDLAAGRVGALVGAVAVGVVASLVLLSAGRPAAWLTTALVLLVVRIGQEHGGWSTGSFVERHGRAGVPAAVEAGAGVLASLPAALLVGVFAWTAAGGSGWPGAELVLAAAAAVAAGVAGPRILGALGRDWLPRYGRVVPMLAATIGLVAFVLAERIPRP